MKIGRMTQRGKKWETRWKDTSVIGNVAAKLMEQMKDVAGIQRSEGGRRVFIF